MDNVFELSQRLQYYKETNPKVIDPDSDAGQYGDNRHTYCHIMYYISKEIASRPEHIGWHKIQVRGWRTTMDYRMIEISCVSWTLAVGTATLALKDEHFQRHKIRILEDEPTMQVLYE